MFSTCKLRIKWRIFFWFWLRTFCALSRSSSSCHRGFVATFCLTLIRLGLRIVVLEPREAAARLAVAGGYVLRAEERTHVLLADIYLSEAERDECVQFWIATAQREERFLAAKLVLVLRLLIQNLLAVSF